MTRTRARGLLLIGACVLALGELHGGRDLPAEVVLARDSRSLASFRDALNAVELGTLTECLSIWSIGTEKIFSGESYRHRFEFAPERAHSRRTRVVSYETEFQLVEQPFSVHAPQWSSGGRGNREAPIVVDRNGLEVLRLALADDQVFQFLEEWITRSDFSMVDLRVTREDTDDAGDVETYLTTFLLRDGDMVTWQTTYFLSTRTAIFELRLP